MNQFRLLLAKQTIRSLSMKATTVSNTPGPIESSIRASITRSLSPTFLAITNDSAAHAGHSAMRSLPGGSGGPETHFSVLVVSPQFEAKRPLARHRLVNAALAEEFKAGLHALVISAKTPAEREAELE